MTTIFLMIALTHLPMLNACTSTIKDNQATDPTLGANSNPTHEPISEPIRDPLFDTISELDSKVFDAFNSCVTPGQLDVYSSYFSSDVEFYHDNGGVTWTREAMVSATKKNVCGKFQRELVPGSLRVFPIKDFGAIAEGEHRFCKFGESHCDGIAKFTIIWRIRDSRWKITRALSYGHRANK